MRNAIAIAFFAGAGLTLAACGGGTGTTTPHVSAAQGASSASGALAVSRSVAANAPAGIRVAVHLPLRNSAGLDALIAQQSDKNSPMYHHFLTPAQFRATYAPTVADVQTATLSLQAAGFTVATTSQGILADAPQGVVERTFQTKLRQGLSHGRQTASAALVPQGGVTLPAALAQLGASIPSFNAIPAAHVHSIRSRAAVPLNRNGPDGFYWFDDLKQAYAYPSYQELTGAGRTIGIVIDSDVSDADTALYFGHEKLAPPTVTRRLVDGGSGAFDPNAGDASEASLDVQMAGGSAPGASIVLYNPPDLSINSIFDAYQAVVEDNSVDIVNSSFGLCELFFTAAYNGGVDATSIETAFHDVFRQGTAQGMTFVSSSGDNGALGCPDVTFTHFVFGVEWPTADPNVTSVGGTNLVTAVTPGSLNSAYVRENAFDDPLDPAQVGLTGGVFGSGGGVSTFWPKPIYQLLVNTRASMRSVPDVALHMGGCPGEALQPCGPDRSFDIEVVGQQGFGVVGTSASSPEFAGLLALAEQGLGGSRFGNENFELYAFSLINETVPGGFFRQNIPGNNGYATRPGYNFVLGNGTVVGKNFVLRPFGPVAGIPQTPSNP